MAQKFVEKTQSHVFFRTGAGPTDLRKVDDHFDVVDRKESSFSAHRTFEPVVIDACQKSDYVSLLES